MREVPLSGRSPLRASSTWWANPLNFSLYFCLQSRKRSTVAAESEAPSRYHVLPMVEDEQTNTYDHPKYCRKMSQKENSLKWREHNLFTKKVPRDAEAANIQVRGSIRERSCLHFLFAGCNNPIDLSTTGCIHPAELSSAP